MNNPADAWDDARTRAAFVTGASSGLGRATATALARAGYDVALIARGAVDLAGTAAAVRAAGRRAVELPADLADAGAVDRAREAALQTLGGIDVLVNAAATDAPAPAEQLALADWQRIIAVNLTAPFLLARGLMPAMGERGGGLVVNVSSVAGRRGWANASAYCSTKFALTGLTQSLAAEGRDRGIRVCCLYPGAMATAWGAFDPQDRPGAAASGGAAAEEALDPETVADLIVWMAESPGRPVLNEATISPLREQGWP